MARKRTLEGGKREEIIRAALEIFLENGYEETSVRMILAKVGGEVGMFYHYFTSKEEIFNEAIKLFFAEFAQKFAVALHTDHSPHPNLDGLLTLVEQSIFAYNKLNHSRFHWSMRIALNQLTIKILVPHVSAKISEWRKGQFINPIIAGTDDELASLLLFGAHGMLHEKPLTGIEAGELARKKEIIKEWVTQVLGMQNTSTEGANGDEGRSR